MIYETEFDVFNPVPHWDLCWQNVAGGLRSRYPNPIFPVPGEKIMQAFDPPTYFGNDGIVFHTMTSIEQTHTDVYTVAVFEKPLFRYTMNDEEEYFPQMDKQGVFYLKKDDDEYMLHCRKFDKALRELSNEISLNIKTPYFRLLNDCLIYLNMSDYRSSHKTGLKGIRIDDLLRRIINPTDLTINVRKYLLKYSLIE